MKEKLNILLIEAMGRRFSDTVNEITALVNRDSSPDNREYALNTLERMKIYNTIAYERTGVTGFRELFELIERNEDSIYGWIEEDRELIAARDRD